MKIEMLKEKEVNYIRYCRIHIHKDLISCSLWIPSKDFSKNRKILTLDYTDDGLLIYDPSNIIKEKIEGDDFYSFLNNLLTYITSEDIYFLQSIEDKLTKMEDNLINKDEIKDFEANIFKIRKLISIYSSYYNQLTEIIERVSSNSNLFDSLDRRLNRLANYTNHLAEYSTELREMHHTKVEMKQNQIMQLLTIVTTIFMPLTLITGWYGMNFKVMPELQTDNGYFVVIGICAAIIIIECIYFKKKKWF